MINQMVFEKPMSIQHINLTMVANWFESSSRVRKRAYDMNVTLTPWKISPQTVADQHGPALADPCWPAMPYVGQLMLLHAALRRFGVIFFLIDMIWWVYPIHSSKTGWRPPGMWQELLAIWTPQWFSLPLGQTDPNLYLLNVPTTDNQCTIFCYLWRDMMVWHGNKL